MNDAANCMHRQFSESQSYCPDCGLSRSEVLVAACEPLLKDGETPAECIARNRRDVDGCLTMLVAEKRKTEALRARLAEAEALLLEATTLLFDWDALVGGTGSHATETRDFLARVGYDPMTATLRKADSEALGLYDDKPCAECGMRSAFGMWHKPDCPTLNHPIQKPAPPMTGGGDCSGNAIAADKSEDADR